MPVTLLRHTTPLGGAGRCYGRTDLAVDPDEVARAADRVVSLLSAGEHRGGGSAAPGHRIVTSPLGRARALAEPIAEALGRELVVDDRFTEMDFGTWEGVLWDSVPRAGLDAWAADLLGYRGHGGESVGDLAARVASGLTECEVDDVVVCHLGVIRAALAARGSGDPWAASVPFGGVVVLPDDGGSAR